MKVIGRMPNTLKLTHRSVDCVLQTISFSIARAIKKPIHRLVNIIHPSFCNFNALPKRYFKRGLLISIPP